MWWRRSSLCLLGMGWQELRKAECYDTGLSVQQRRVLAKILIYSTTPLHAQPIPVGLYAQSFHLKNCSNLRDHFCSPQLLIMQNYWNINSKNYF
jgi:hypothetical protein